MTDEDLAKEVDRLLADRGMTIIDGFPRATAPTGQRYKQMIVTVANVAYLSAAIADAICNSNTKAKTVYWRIRPDRHGCQAYIRFLVSDRKAA
jgi:hypothetical protein